MTLLLISIDVNCGNIITRLHKIHINWWFNEIFAHSAFFFSHSQQFLFVCFYFCFDGNHQFGKPPIFFPDFSLSSSLSLFHSMENWFSVEIPQHIDQNWFVTILHKKEHSNRYNYVCETIICSSHLSCVQSFALSFVRSHCASFWFVYYCRC